MAKSIIMKDAKGQLDDVEAEKLANIIIGSISADNYKIFDIFNPSNKNYNENYLQSQILEIMKEEDLYFFTSRELFKLVAYKKNGFEYAPHKKLLDAVKNLMKSIKFIFESKKYLMP